MSALDAQLEEARFAFLMTGDRAPYLAALAAFDAANRYPSIDVEVSE